MLTEGNYASGRYLLNARNRVYTLDQLKTGEFNANQVGAVLDDFEDLSKGFKKPGLSGVSSELREGSLVPKGQTTHFELDRSTGKEVLIIEDTSYYRIDDSAIYERLGISSGVARQDIRSLFQTGTKSSEQITAEIETRIFDGKAGIVPFSKTCSEKLGACTENAILYQLFSQPRLAPGDKLYFVSGKLGSGGSVEEHAFNILVSKGNAYLLDVTLPYPKIGREFVVPITGIKNGVIQLPVEYNPMGRVYSFTFDGF